MFTITENKFDLILGYDVGVLITEPNRNLLQNRTKKIENQFQIEKIVFFFGARKNQSIRFDFRFQKLKTNRIESIRIFTYIFSNIPLLLLYILKNTPAPIHT